MRPRRARLGCEILILHLDNEVLAGFNEAEARAPRMRRRRKIPSRREPGFNEAEARAPLMLSTTTCPVILKLPASMRPRRARLGCMATEALVRQHPDGFNEAEARAPRMLVGGRGVGVTFKRLQ